MTRETVRSLKKSIRASARPNAHEAAVALSRESALALLARSIDFGHGRLAIVRLAVAVNSGASIPPEHWAYCSRVIAASNADKALCDMYVSAATRAGRAHQASRPHINEADETTPTSAR